MSITMRGVTVANVKELYARCNEAEAQRDLNDLKHNRLSTLEGITEREGPTLGTIDASSCIGVAYWTPQGSLFVQHHDGISCESLRATFDFHAFKGPGIVNVTLVGGYRNSNPRGEFTPDYKLIEKLDTRHNIKTLFGFWQRAGYRINIQNWAIGDDKSNDTLCSDFLAAKQGKVMLLKPGVALQSGLVPEVARRLVTSLFHPSKKYIYVYDSTLGHHLSLPALKPNPDWCSNVESIKKALSDRELVPDPLQPPHFTSILRQLPPFFTKEMQETRIALRPNDPVIVVQRELGHLKHN